MIGVSVRITGPGLGDPRRRLPAALRPQLLLVTSRLEREVKILTPVGVTEAGRGSIAGEVRLGDRITPGEPVAMVGSPLVHVAVVNNGRKPGGKLPPIGPLALWVRRKIEIEVEQEGGAVAKRAPTVAEAAGIAFLIAQKIKRRGTEPVQMFEKAAAQHREWIARTLGVAGVRLAKDVTTGKKG